MIWCLPSYSESCASSLGRRLSLEKFGVFLGRRGIGAWQHAGIAVHRVITNLKHRIYLLNDIQSRQEVFSLCYIRSDERNYAPIEWDKQSFVHPVVSGEWSKSGRGEGDTGQGRKSLTRPTHRAESLAKCRCTHSFNGSLIRFYRVCVCPLG